MAESEQKQQKQYPTNLAFKAVGRVAYDADIFNATCGACKGGYNSQRVLLCPKCGRPLSPISTKYGVVSIAEFRIYPWFGAKTMELYNQELVRRKGTCPIVWRFKLVQYSSKSPVDHPFTMFLKKGSVVDVRVFNHPPFATEFKLNKPDDLGFVKNIELMWPIYEDYADKIVLVSRPAQKMVVESTNAPPSPSHTVDGVSMETISRITREITAQVTAKVTAAFAAYLHPKQPDPPTVIEKYAEIRDTCGWEEHLDYVDEPPYDQTAPWE